MFYRVVGQYNETYAADNRLIPVALDRWCIWLTVIVMIFVVPFVANTYWLSAVLIPILILSLASLGLNILTGYTGQLSLGTGGFMAIGAFSTFNLMINIPQLNLLVAILLGGLFSGLVGLIVGLPSYRIKGFYVIVSTLMLQYLVYWVIVTYPFLRNYSTSGLVTLPPKHYKIFGLDLFTPQGKYILTITIVVILTIIAANMTRSAVGRNWMAVRDFDTAARVLGIEDHKATLLAFFVSSFYIGIAGALYSYCYLGQVDPAIYDLRRSFIILFMIIIGGLGSITGAFFGAAFVYYLPILTSWLGHQLTGGALDSGFIENMSKGVYGAIIIALVIKEPGGLAAIWSKCKKKLVNWPFRY